MTLRSSLGLPILRAAFLLLVAAGPSRVSAADESFSAPVIPLPKIAARRFDVRAFGATGAGEKNDTAAINRAIAACHDAGGGEVLFPAGTYLAASIHLLSNVQLTLAAQAVITGADKGYDAAEPNEFDRYQDFGHSHFHNALMWGENLENFAIVGGTINGGHIIPGTPKPGQDIGDKVIAIKVGRNLLFSGVSHDTGGHFVYLLDDCANITLANITIRKSRDAVDLMGCRNVAIHDCHFTGCGDDTVGIKSDYALGRKIMTENIYVWDSYFETDCNGVQFGSETAGDFGNIKVWNVTIGKAGKAALGITCNDGGVIDGVDCRNITIRHATNPIFMLITKRLRTGEPGQKVGAIRNIRISHVTAADCQPSRDGQVNPITLAGLPEAPIENIVLEDIRVIYPGGGTAAQADLQPRYPTPGEYAPRAVGGRPAWGVYARNVRGLILSGIELAATNDDGRPALAADDVTDLQLQDFQAEKMAGVETLRLAHVQNLIVRRCPGLADRTVATIDQAKY